MMVVVATLFAIVVALIVVMGRLAYWSWQRDSEAARLEAVKVRKDIEERRRH